MLQPTDTSISGSKDDEPEQNGSKEPEPGTSGDRTSGSKKDKSEFIKLRVVGQVSSIALVADSKKCTF